jgi:hypothetical protein
MLSVMSTPTDPRTDPRTDPVLGALLKVACDAVWGRWVSEERLKNAPELPAEERPHNQPGNADGEGADHSAACNRVGGGSIPNAEGETSMPSGFSVSVTTNHL